MIIAQKPLYKMLATDEEIIFVVEDNAVVVGNFRVKFIAEVYVSSASGNPFGSHPSASKVATLKVVPNNEGVGIFDLSRILEAYVSPDYLGGETISAGGTQYYTEYNQVDYSDKKPHSLHQIDKWSTNRNSCRLLGVKFSAEYSTTQTGTLTTTTQINSELYYIHNAVRQEDDTLAIDSNTGNFGYNYDFNKYVLNSTAAKFLSNAPTTQYIGENDFCTLGFFAQSDGGVGSFTAGSRYGKFVGSSATSAKQLIRHIDIKFFDNGVQTGSTITYGNSTANGSLTWQSVNPKAQLQYVGIGTGNIQGAGNTLPASWDYYTVTARDYDGVVVSDTYKFYKQEVCKGYEKFRLTWLNRLGVWDYFNFTKKNVRKINSKRETYQQIKGSWNESRYIKHGYKGGQKVFATNSKEVISLQTDYITEEAAQWLEELFTSPEVFVLQERSTDTTAGSVTNLLGKYVQPCVVMNSSYTRKTTANDKLKQYTIEIEMSHNKRIQKA